MVRIIEIFLSLKRLLSIHSQISFVTVATTFMIYDLRFYDQTYELKTITNKQIYFLRFLILRNGQPFCILVRFPSGGVQETILLNPVSVLTYFNQKTSHETFWKFCFSIFRLGLIFKFREKSFSSFKSFLSLNFFGKHNSNKVALLIWIENLVKEKTTICMLQLKFHGIFHKKST